MSLKKKKQTKVSSFVRVSFFLPSFPVKPPAVMGQLSMRGGTYPTELFPILKTKNAPIDVSEYNQVNGFRGTEIVNCSVRYSIAIREAFRRQPEPFKLKLQSQTEIMAAAASYFFLLLCP